jgi:predicted transcriptional regulator
MGVYSNLAVQKINEQEMLENFRFSDLLEFAIDIQKSDQAMFDAMLEMDFHEAYESKGIITLTEGEKIDALKAAAKGIWGKIVETLSKFLSIVKTFFAKVSNVFAELSGKNKMLVEKIGPLDQKKLLTAVGDNESQVTIIDQPDAFKRNLLSRIDKVRNAMNKAVAGDTDSIKSDIESDIKNLHSAIEENFVKVSIKDSISKVNLKNLYNSVKSPEIDKDLKNTVDKLIEDIETNISKFKKDKDGEEVSQEDRAKYSNIISGLNICMSGATKIFSVIKSYFARKVAAERALYTKYGTLLGTKLTVGNKVDLAANAGKAVGDKAKEAGKDAAGKVADAAKGAKDAVASKFGGGLKLKAEAAEELEYQFMAIDVVNETYIEELFA